MQPGPNFFLASLLAVTAAADPCRSGLRPGERPGPYSSVISTGSERGRSHCYICETGERPAVVVFARSLSEPLAKLAREIDKAVGENTKQDLRAWITFLNEDQLHFDSQVVAWSQKHALRHLPLGIFEDVGGPPSYRLSGDADVTVLLFVKQKVVANFAFRAGELTNGQIGDISRAFSRLLPEPK
jgi:hypothetical protein